MRAEKLLLLLVLIINFFLSSFVISQYTPAEIALSLMYLNPLITPENKELAKYFKMFDFASIIQEFSQKSDDESLFYTGVSWFHMLNYTKAKEYLKQVKNPRLSNISAYIINKIDVVTTGNKSAYENWIKAINNLNNSMAKSERAFMKSLMEKKPYLEDLANAYQEAIKEYNSEKIDCLDIQAFNYILFLKDRNLEQAHTELNRVVKYDFSLNQNTLYYDSNDLKLLSYPVIRLLSEVLYLRAVKTIELLFKTSLEDFIKMDDKKRNELVLQTYIKDKGNYNSLIYYLENSLNVIILGKNNYYFVQSIKEPSVYFSESAYSLNEKVRRLLMYTKLN